MAVPGSAPPLAPSADLPPSPGHGREPSRPPALQEASREGGRQRRGRGAGPRGKGKAPRHEGLTVRRLRGGLAGRRQRRRCGLPSPGPRL